MPGLRFHLLVVAAAPLCALSGTSNVRLKRMQPHNRALALRGGSLNMGLAGLGSAYASSLSTNPILTKSVTSGAIFALSDVAGQTIEGAPQGRDLKRSLTSGLVGLLYFGPALHHWLAMLTKVLPGFDAKSTLLKTLLGQAFFGPTITCVFFGAALLSTEGLVAGLKAWPKKIKQDLFKTWSAGLCYWPLIDLVCYGMVLPLLGASWIPLGYNVASFFWTIYLSVQAARYVVV